MDRTIGDYLDLQKYSSTFTDRFLIPAFAGINTVSCQEVRDYPAALIAQYFNRDFIVSSVYRAVGGAHTIAGALSQRVAQLRLRAHICSVRRQAKTVVITMEDGSAETFDAVVFATQANLHQLDVLHAQPERRVFFCGFYAAQGIPLLESAVASALHIAQTDNFKP